MQLGRLEDILPDDALEFQWFTVQSPLAAMYHLNKHDAWTSAMQVVIDRFVAILEFGYESVHCSICNNHSIEQCTSKKHFNYVWQVIGNGASRWQTVHVAGGIIKFNHVNGHLVAARVYARDLYSRSQCLSSIEHQYRAQWLNIGPRKYAVTPLSAAGAKYYPSFGCSYKYRRHFIDGPITQLEELMTAHDVTSGVTTYAICKETLSIDQFPHHLTRQDHWQRLGNMFSDDFSILQSLRHVFDIAHNGHTGKIRFNYLFWDIDMFCNEAPGSPPPVPYSAPPKTPSESGGDPYPVEPCDLFWMSQKHQSWVNLALVQVGPLSRLLYNDGHHSLTCNVCKCQFTDRLTVHICSETHFAKVQSLMDQGVDAVEVRQLFEQNFVLCHFNLQWDRVST